MTSVLSRLALSMLLLIFGNQAFADICVGEVVVEPPVNISTTDMNINWTLSFGSINGFRIYLSDATAGANLPTITVSASVRSHHLIGLNPGRTYTITVEAFKNICLGAGGVPESSFSETISVATIPTNPTATTASTIGANSFIANWNASSGAENYRLDVSLNNFTTILTDFNDLLVNGTSQVVNGLASGTSYSYRVRAINASGASTNSNTIVAKTISAAPETLAATDIATGSFTAKWNASVGADNYRLDVSVDNFATKLSGFNDLLVNGTSQAVSGLLSGTQYQYRVRAINASGISNNSNSIVTKTISIAPDHLSTSSVGVDSFTINWSAVTGAESYLLDISADNFSTFIIGFNSKGVNSLSQLISGLNPGTTYQARVRAVNMGGVSANSLPSSQITLPSAPLDFKTTDSQPSAIKVFWLSVQSATEYQLEVSLSETFTALLAGYNPKIISGSTNVVVTGLESSTIYYFRVRAKNSSGLSAYSALQTASTLPSDGSIREIVFGSLQQPEVHLDGQQKEISVSASGGIGTLAVNFFHRKKSESLFSSESVNLSNGIYRVNVEQNWFDDFGMEFYFEASDLINQTKKSTTQTILRGIDKVTLPVPAFGKELSNYQIVSIPYILDRTLVRDAFEKVMGTYDKKKWRFSQYQNGKIIDYEEGIGASNLEQGKGYWFISKNEVDLSFGQGKSFGNSLALPFKLQLKKGWNQIGNPFPYNLSWQEVLTANNNPSIVSNLYVFDRANVSFIENDLLPVFGGGFVFAEETMELNFPVTLSSKSGGRIKSNNFHPDLNHPEDWFLPIQLKQGEIVNTLSGVGMFVNAKDGKDVYDKVTAPRFVRYLEFNTRVEGYAVDLARNISSPSSNKVWNYTIESNSGEPVELQWDNKLIKSLSGDVILYDESKQTLVNMAHIDRYLTSSSARINIYFNGEKSIASNDVRVFGQPYPNPFQGEVIIPFDYSQDESTTQASLQIFDSSGALVASREVGHQSNHVKSISWDGLSNDGVEVQSGFYLYKVNGQQASGRNFNFVGKLIKK